MMGCLAREDGSGNIRPLLQTGNPNELVAAAQRALRCKRTTAGFAQSANMAVIGG